MHRARPGMRVLEIRPSQRLKGWTAFEAPGVKPTFSGPTGSRAQLIMPTLDSAAVAAAFRLIAVSRLVTPRRSLNLALCVSHTGFARNVAATDVILSCKRFLDENWRHSLGCCEPLAILLSTARASVRQA